MERPAPPALEIAVDDLAERVDAEDPPLLIDVRELHEQATGVLPGALPLPLSGFDRGIGALSHERGRAIVVYCASGKRSADAAGRMRSRGFEPVWNLRGGIEAWRVRGLRIEAPATADRTALDAAQLERYARQLSLREIGLAGQRRLLDSRVLCIGAGGLGSPACLYLAAAGVGEIQIVDDDLVTASNLQRQILHSTARIGVPKADSAALAIAALNPDVRLRLHRARLCAQNAIELLSDCDVVVDGSDNFATRYVVNDAALRLDKPVVSGAVLRYEAQIAVFGGAPCYRCLFPSAPPAEFSPSCVEAGVLGVVPGLIGVLQATEALKLILRIGAPSFGRLITYDALTLRFSELTVKADPACPSCAPHVDRSRLVIRDDPPQFASCPTYP